MSIDRRVGAVTGVEAAELVDRLASLARALQEEEDVQETLDAIVRAAVGTVPGAQHASISTILRRREVVTRASTSDLPRANDQAQHDAQEGPCLDTLYEQQTVRLPDLAKERRWPEFARRSMALGVGSMLSVQLFVRGNDLGALNLVSESIDAFDEESEHIALLFASHAAVAMSDAQDRERLLKALGTRDLVGQAKGILMERYKVNSEQAFRLLVHASQDTNRKLHEIAEQLVLTGELAGR